MTRSPPIVSKSCMLVADERESAAEALDRSSGRAPRRTWKDFSFTIALGITSIPPEPADCIVELLRRAVELRGGSKNGLRLRKEGPLASILRLAVHWSSLLSVGMSRGRRDGFLIVLVIVWFRSGLEAVPSIGSLRSLPISSRNCSSHSSQTSAGRRVHEAALVVCHVKPRSSLEPGFSRLAQYGIQV